MAGIFPTTGGGTIAIRDLGPALRVAQDAADPTRLDFQRVLLELRVYLWSQGRMRFAEGTSPNGVPWAPLAVPRNRPRDKAGRKLPGGKPQGRQKPLRDRGLLMASMSAQAQGTVSTTGPRSLEQGTNLFYAAWHQFGVPGPIKPTKKKALFWPGAAHPVMSTRGIPARPFAGVSEKMADRVASIVADDVVRQLVGAGGK